MCVCVCACVITIQNMTDTDMFVNVFILFLTANLVITVQECEVREIGSGDRMSQGPGFPQQILVEGDGGRY